MKIDKWVEFTPMCEDCSLRGRDFESKGYVSEGYVMANTRKEAKAQARKAGWKVIGGKTLCPRCAAKPSPSGGGGIP